MALGVSCAALIQALASLVGGWPFFDGSFRGPDSYMRLNRVLECGGGPGCPGGLFPRSNAPFGEVLHWPLLQDWLLMGIAAPFQLFLPPKAALETAGYLLGPILQIGAIAAVLWASRPLVAGRAWILSGVFLTTQLWVLQAFAPSRPDHHGLQALFFLLAVAGAIRLLVRGPGRVEEAVTGLGVAGGLWVSVEGLATVTVPLLVLGLRWIGTGERLWVLVNARVSSWCVLLLGVAVLVDGPQAGRLAAVYDRISVVHLIGFAGAALFWWGIHAVGVGRTAGRRLMWCSGGLALLVSGLSVPFPGLIRGPLADVDSRIVPIWLDHVAEYVTLPESGPRVLVMGIGSLVLALPTAWMAYRREGPGVRWGWGLILGAMMWFGALGLFHGARWAYYVSLLVPIPYAWLTSRVFSVAGTARSKMAKAAAEVGVVAVLALGIPLAVALSGPGTTPATSTDAFAVACPERELHRVLAAASPGRPGAAMLAPLWWGPEIIYRTRLDVISTPYHRNHAGILASRDMMLAQDEDGALRRLEARGIEYVLICRGQEWSPALDEVLDGSLFGRLQRDDPPAFLEPVALPEGLADRYGLWRLSRPRGE
jgi:hypothetical protein